MGDSKPGGANHGDALAGDHARRMFKTVCWRSAHDMSSLGRLIGRIG
jgi:hypothetical protein